MTHIFLSHSDKDHVFIDHLRKSLEFQGLDVWVDNTKMSAGDGLDKTIKEAIEQARAFIVVFSSQTFNSKWVLKEVRHALKVRKKQGKKEDGFVYPLIPLLIEGVSTDALELYFQEETAGIEIEMGPGGISEAMPRILAALGERSADAVQPMVGKGKQDSTELLLELTEPEIKDINGKKRAGAKARLICIPADTGQRKLEARFIFTAPIGPIEKEELSWYLERYYLWPSGVFRQRAQQVEASLQVWGKQLYDALFDLGSREVNQVLAVWQKGGHNGARRFSVLTATADEAASALLTLPWELLHDGTGYLFQGGSPVQVRRRLPNTKNLTRLVTEPPIRVLLASPRPEDENSGYIDHRISALPLVSALEELGDLVQLTVLTPPTFKALGETLWRAKQEGTPFHVVHFDGHGVFDRAKNLGGLCFEDARDMEKREKRKSHIIDAPQIAATMRDHNIPLVFLDACQSAQTELDPGSSVAAALLQQGVASVVAMSHTVLVETAKRFVGAFYRQLAMGLMVGEAMLAGRIELYEDMFRFKVFGAGELELQDWFVPVLYQEKEDLQLLTRIPSRPMRELDQKALRTRLGELPEEPVHGFVGRSRELLTLERLLADEKVTYAVVLGQGGEGKTTLAVELVRWLVRTQRFGRAVFVCMEGIYDVRAVADSIGRQLLPGYSVAQYESMEKALPPIVPKVIRILPGGDRTWNWSTFLQAR